MPRESILRHRQRVLAEAGDTGYAWPFDGLGNLIATADLAEMREARRLAASTAKDKDGVAAKAFREGRVNVKGHACSGVAFDEAMQPQAASPQLATTTPQPTTQPLPPTLPLAESCACDGDSRENQGGSKRIGVEVRWL